MASGNRLTSKGVKGIIVSMKEVRIEEIDLSDNKLDIESVKMLVSEVILYQNSESSISYLNLSKNRLGDVSIEILCKALFNYKSL